MVEQMLSLQINQNEENSTAPSLQFANLKQIEQLPIDSVVLAVDVYADCIFETMIRQEVPPRARMRYNITRLSRRFEMLRMYEKIAKEYQLHRTTIHLAVYLLDSVLESFVANDPKLPLIAAVCINLAVKHEESETHKPIPKLAQLRQFVPESCPFTKQDYNNAELTVLAIVKFTLFKTTIAEFSEYFCQRGVLTLEDFELYQNKWEWKMLAYIASEDRESSVEPIFFENYEHMANTLNNDILLLTDHTLKHTKMMQFRPLISAAAVIAVVRKKRHLVVCWTPYLKQLTRCVLPDIYRAIKVLMRLYKVHCCSISTNEPNITHTNTVLNSEQCDNNNSNQVSDEENCESMTYDRLDYAKRIKIE